jgi:antimicrobial peptide system SdpB family protein
MLAALGRWATRNVAVDPWTNVYGFARSILALGTTLTLVLSPPAALFVPGVGALDYPHCGVGLQKIGLFCTIPQHLDLARWLAVGALLLVASGFRPRLTGLLHWWVTFSLANNATVVDGGDAVASVLTLLLIPLTLTDDRRWHWDTRRALSSAPDERETAKRLTAGTALFLIRLQVAGIYFHAAVAKFSVLEWTNGTVLYYLVNDPIYGAAPWIRPFTAALVGSAVWLPLTTWSVLLLEYSLGAGLLVAKDRRWVLLLAGIAFHFGIVLLHGLVSFGLAMTAALIMFLRPPEKLLLPKPAALRALLSNVRSLRAPLFRGARREA